MCKLGLIFLISFLTGNNYAQDYFVLLQSGNRQPFYVRLGGHLYSSTPEGHLILSRLKDSSYTIAIGFPAKPGVEQTYLLGALHNDQEFEIKDHDETGWGLYDCQTREWLALLSRTGGREEVHALGVRRDDAFSRLMAGVVHDTAVLYNDFTNSELATTPTPPVPTATPPATAANSTGTAPGTANPATINSAAQPDSAGAATTQNHPDTSTALVTKLDPPARQNTAAAQDTSAALGAKPDISAAPAPKTDSSAAPALTGSVTKADPAVNKMDSAVARSDSAAAPLFRPVAGNPGHKAPPVVDSARKTPLYRPAPAIVKISQIKLSRNMRLVYADKGNGGKVDTVVVIIPLDTTRATPAVALKTRIPAADSSRSPVTRTRTVNADSGRTAAARAHGPNFDTPAGVHVIVPTPVNPPAADKPRSNDSARKPASKSQLPYVNSDCHNFATDYDVDKLRVKMLEAGKDDQRITAALKVFRTRCFFTRQIRALSEIFTTDASKYRFFETAYPFAADEHFRDLVTLLADPVYAGKFKTLTGMR
jgi:hypothetical protein